MRTDRTYRWGEFKKLEARDPEHADTLRRDWYQSAVRAVHDCHAKRRLNRTARRERDAYRCLRRIEGLLQSEHVAISIAEWPRLRAPERNGEGQSADRANESETQRQ